MSHVLHTRLAARGLGLPGRTWMATVAALLALVAAAAVALVLAIGGNELDQRPLARLRRRPPARSAGPTREQDRGGDRLGARAVVERRAGRGRRGRRHRRRLNLDVGSPAQAGLPV